MNRVRVVAMMSLLIAAVFASAWIGIHQVRTKKPGRPENGDTAQKSATQNAPRRNLKTTDILVHIAQVRTDLRTLAQALELIRNDYRFYPKSTASFNPDMQPSTDEGNLSEPPTFLNRITQEHPKWPQSMSDLSPVQRRGLVTLTTPMAYILSTPSDPFAPKEGAPYRYHCLEPEFSEENLSQWIIWSAGPDQDYDIDWKRFSGNKQDSRNLHESLTYDPSNGLISDGDIIFMQ